MKENITITKGKSFKKVIRWETDKLKFVPMTAVTGFAPFTVSSTAHGLYDGWRVAVAAAVGVDASVNTKYDPDTLLPTTWHEIVVVDANTIQIPTIPPDKGSAYKSGGHLQYLEPFDFTSFTARMSIKNKIGGDVIDSGTSEDATIVLDAATSTITLLLDATNTALYAGKKGVYDLELVSPSGFVYDVLSGTAAFESEVTT